MAQDKTYYVTYTLGTTSVIFMILLWHRFFVTVQIIPNLQHANITIFLFKP